MPNIGMINYEVILNNEYLLQNVVESITLEESLDEVAYRATIKLVVTKGLPEIIPGQEIVVKGAPVGGSLQVLLRGIVWHCDSSNKGLKEMLVTVYEPTIYMARSEDEYLFPAGQTASQRLQKYTADWRIEIGNIVDTKIKLAKAIYRTQNIYRMIQSDLNETVAKGGDMYRPRIIEGKLELFRLGSNYPFWILDINENLEAVNQRRTLDGTVTQVKVLGSAADEKRSPVITIKKANNNELGTIQRIIQNSKVKTLSAANMAATQMLCGIQEIVTVTGIDINTVRAGDKLLLKEYKEWELLATSVRHELGSPGHMVLELATPDYVKRRFYEYGSI